VRRGDRWTLAAEIVWLNGARVPDARLVAIRDGDVIGYLGPAAEGFTGQRLDYVFVASNIDASCRDRFA
jgi:hypothetical protein